MFRNIQLIDGLNLYQDHENIEMPEGKTREFVVDVQSGKVLSERHPTVSYEGSHSTTISIRISPNRITVARGNPSKINRLDNLFGYNSIDACIATYNQILLSLKLPPFTKCTKTWQMFCELTRKFITLTNGAVLTEIHTTTNKSVGKGNELTYLRALSTQRLRNSIPHLSTNGYTVQWLSKLGHAALVHSSCYAKANEILLHQLPKIKRLHGDQSSEYKYLLRVYEFCLEHGVVRFENKHKSRSLRRNSLQHWGLSDFKKLDDLQNELINIDKKLGITVMNMQTIVEELKDKQIVKSTQAANSTATYYFMWLQGHSFDFKKSQVKIHRARLRKLNIDIAEICDINKHTPVRIKEVQELTVEVLQIPSWYRQPQQHNLRLVA